MNDNKERSNHLLLRFAQHCGGYYEKNKRSQEPPSRSDLMKKAKVSGFLTLLLLSRTYEDLPSFPLS